MTWYKGELVKDKERRASALMVVARAIRAEYDAARSAAGVRPLYDTKGAFQPYFNRLAEYIIASDIDVKDFMNFAVERGRSIVKGSKIASVSLICSNYMVNEYDSRDTETLIGIAGQRYADPGRGLRDSLVAAGFPRAAEYDEATLRFIEQYANSMAKFPAHFQEPDPDYAGEILALLQQQHQQGEG